MSDKAQPNVYRTVVVQQMMAFVAALAVLAFVAGYLVGSLNYADLSFQASLVPYTHKQAPPMPEPPRVPPPTPSPGVSESREGPIYPPRNFSLPKRFGIDGWEKPLRKGKKR